jgi:hypothetical protein
MDMDIEEIMKMCAAQGKPVTREKAAVFRFCFQEGIKRGESPIAILMEIMEKYNLTQNLGNTRQADNPGGIAPPSKPSWQL